MIPRDHPRYESLMVREKLVSGYKEGIAVLEGLIAHGRGEAFNYLLGERTIPPAREAIKAAAALLATAKAPVISVNGNTASLCPEDMISLAEKAGAKLEVNLFYRSEDRIKRIKEKLIKLGAREVLSEADAEIQGLSSPRRLVAKSGIYSADVVLVAIEDGDRTQALVEQGKKVIAIDLNPLSRTARTATITIVDDVLRAVPEIARRVEYFKENIQEAEKVLRSYNRDENLQEVLNYICEFLKGEALRR